MPPKFRQKILKTNEAIEIYVRVRVIQWRSEGHAGPATAGGRGLEGRLNGPGPARKK